MGNVKNNNKGYSLIELIVVIAILVVATAVTAGSLSSAFHARSYKATKTIDGMIAQSKVNAMSGRKNIMIVRYDESKKTYVCSLHNAVKNTDGSFKKNADGKYLYEKDSYESQDVGNKSLVITADTYNLINAEEGTSNGSLVIDYNMDTGGINSVRYFSSGVPKDTDGNYILNGGSYLLGGSSTEKTADIVFSYYTTHNITLYKSTGEHDYE